MKTKLLQLSHVFALDVYRASSSFPIAERYALTTQMRQLAVSVSCSCAVADLDAAQEELIEMEYLLILAQDLGYLPADSARVLFDRATTLQDRLLRSKADRRADAEAPPVEVQ